MNINRRKRILCRTLQALVSVMLLAGCAGLPAPQVESPSIYVLDAQPAIKAAQAKRDLVLAVSLPRARPGFDTHQMAYVRQPHALDYFAANRWADTPERMLGPLLAQALEQTGSFRAVVQTPGVVPADVRLDTELIRLQHDFGTRPSRIQLTLRAQLIDVRSKRVLAVKLFDETENAASEDAYGGVTAANRALQRVLEQVADFCIDASASQ
ncbi:MAG: ABC-type transport auxiliary lipoprotein family protein [Gammaproteobacteria bacterium]|nr:ABC-type transport auxiliary lipoprotein family protein [Gammaproteobacteria bacterium]